jgi:hypothetical protein
MSEIPFVNQLGTALESAISAPQPARRRLLRRPRRIGVLALAVLLVGATGVTVARMLADADQVASGAVACFDKPDLSGNVAVLGTITGSPTAACAKAWDGGGAPPAMVACTHGVGVVVIPGRGARACGRAGLAPLPAGYDLAQAKVARLQRKVAGLEASADCIPPDRLAKRAQALLLRSGWTGWQTLVRSEGVGLCGHILTRGGSGGLTLSGALLGETRELLVSDGPPRTLDAQLFGEHSLGVQLMDASGERCYTVAGLQSMARRRLAVTGRPVGFKLGRMPANTGIIDNRGRRYAEGCAISVGAYPVYPEPGVVAVEVEIWRKGG